VRLSNVDTQHGYLTHKLKQTRINTVFLTGTKYALIGNVNKGYGLNND